MTKIYQASSLRKYNTSVPVFCSNANNSWLGKGYYFWEAFIEVAHWWGKTHYYGSYCIYEGDFNLTTPNGLDLSRGEDIQLLRGVVNNLKERQIKRTITVAQAIAALNVIFNNQFTWVRADTTGCSNELTNSIPYGNHSISLSLTPQIQICFLNKKDFKDFFRSLTKVHPNQS